MTDYLVIFPYLCVVYLLGLKTLVEFKFCDIILKPSSFHSCLTIPLSKITPICGDYRISQKGHRSNQWLVIRTCHVWDPSSPPRHTIPEITQPSRPDLIPTPFFKLAIGRLYAVERLPCSLVGSDGGGSPIISHIVDPPHPKRQWV